MNENVKRNLKKEFKKHASTVRVFFRSSKTKGENFDPIRDTGYSVSNLSSRPVKAIVKDSSPNSLIQHNFGLSVAGAKELTILKKDINKFKMAEKVEIDGEPYYKYNDAVGNKFLVTERALGFARIILFKKDV